jgi:peptide methionine sulfoxide reductase msrA/msrB
VTYDTGALTFANLVEHIIKHGDPTDAEGSFYDRGLEYAPAIYYENEAERSEALRVIREIDARSVFADPLPLLVTPRVTFWPAEEYHQDYSTKNPVRYTYYRTASGRSAFIERHWGDSVNTFTVPKNMQNQPVQSKEGTWSSFVKPSDAELRALLTPIQYEVTQNEGTESPFKNAYDKNYAEGIYVDVVSGEPLFLSGDKYDSGTGWPSFVKPISDDAVVLTEDNKLFSKRTEVRSRYADSHIGHVFNDGPEDRGGMRYCMNSSALRFIPRDRMEGEGYAYLLPLVTS